MDILETYTVIDFVFNIDENDFSKSLSKLKMYGIFDDEIYLKKMFELKKTANVEVIKKEFSSNFESDKERKKADFFETIELIVSKKSNDPEVLNSYKFYIDSLKQKIKSSGGNLDFIKQNVFDNAIIKLSNLNLRIGDIIDLYLKTSGTRFYECDFEVKNSLKISILKSLNTLWNNGFWYFEAETRNDSKEKYESALFAAKYLFEENKFKGNNYIEHIKNSSFQQLSKLLFLDVSNDQDKFLDKVEAISLQLSSNRKLRKLLKLNTLLALKDAGLYVLYDAYEPNKGPSKTDIVYYIKDVINNEILTKTNNHLSIRVKSKLECFNEKINSEIDLSNVTIAYPEFFRDDVDNSNVQSNLPLIKIKNINDSFVIDNSTTTKSIVKFSNLSTEEKMKLSSTELSKLEEAETVEKNSKVLAFVNFKLKNEYLKYIFRNNAAELEKALNLISYYCESYNNEVAKKNNSDFKRVLFRENSKYNSFQQKYIDSTDLILSKIFSNGLGNKIVSNKDYIDYISFDFKNIPIETRTGLNMFNLLVNFIKNREKIYLANLDVTEKLLIEKYQSIYNEVSATGNGIDLSSLMENFEALFNSKNNDINPANSSFGGFCEYSNDQFEAGDGSLRIYKGNSFYLSGNIRPINGGSIETSCSGNIIKSGPGDYIFKSDNGDYSMSFVNGKCGKKYMKLRGLGKNSNITFYLDYK
jgi:hypothetical protein